MTSGMMTSRPPVRPTAGARHDALTMLVRYCEAGPGILLDGELDLATAERLEATLRTLTARRSDIWLDLFNLTFCDCAGLSVFVRVDQELRRDGHRLRPHHPSRQVRRMLTLCGLDDAFG